MDDVRCRAVVSGRVQGVYFRDSCRSVATELGVRGWAQNLPDGTVEVVAEGPRDAVDRLLRWCHDGPPRAQVAAVRVSDEEPDGVVGFRVG